MAEEKTNVMRLLDQKKVPYAPHHYDVSDGALDGVTAAARLGVPPETCFKTLVTVGASKRSHVFVIPVERELDLKAAARAAGEKSIEMIRQAPHRLRPRGLLPHRDEKTPPHLYRRQRPSPSRNDGVRREGGLSGDPVSPSLGRLRRGPVRPGEQIKGERRRPWGSAALLLS